MQTNANPIIARLNDTLATKTEAAFAELAGLEQQITQAIAKATQAAQERIEERLANIDYAIGTAMLTFEDRLAEMAGLAVTRAVNHLEGRLADMTATATVQPTEEPVAAASTTYIPTREEIEAEGDGWREEVDAETLAMIDAIKPDQDTSTAGEPLTMPTPALAIQTAEEPVAIAEPVHATVAAHAVAAEPVGVLPEDDEDQDDGEDGIDDAALMASQDTDADDVQTTSDPDGLYVRHGTGRRTRYEVEPLPVEGEVYFRKQGRRWQQVRFVGA